MGISLQADIIQQFSSFAIVLLNVSLNHILLTLPANGFSRPIVVQ